MLWTGANQKIIAPALKTHFMVYFKGTLHEGKLNYYAWSPNKNAGETLLPMPSMLSLFTSIAI